MFGQIAGICVGADRRIYVVDLGASSIRVYDPDGGFIGGFGGSGSGPGELGASLGPTLRIQADHFRVRRAQAAEKAAMEAPVKLLFPLICFFFPATFIVLFGPIFRQFVVGVE